MRTKTTITAIVGAVTLAAIAITVMFILTLGPWAGLGIAAVAAATAFAAYRFLIRRWHARWGATDWEVIRVMPGDDLLPGAASTTRAITIAATAEDVWPWLVQIGYGRAGWYSYDWIDNDGRPSADRIVASFQDLRVGDQIFMAPRMGPKVKAIQPNRYLVADSGAGDTWCLALHPVGDGATRLVSRWRQNWPMTPATVFWTAIAGPGAFVMERKMLKGIKARAERLAASRHPRLAL